MLASSGSEQGVECCQPLSASIFSLAQGTTAEQFLDGLDSLYDERLDGLLSSEESRAAALQSLESPIEVEIAQCIAPIDGWRYATVHFEGSNSQVWLLGNLEHVDFVPTDLESLVFHLLVAGRTEWHGKFWTDAAIVGWRRALSGHAIVATPRGAGHEPTKLRRLIAAIFQIEHADLPRQAVVGSLIELASSVTIRASDVFNILSKTKLLSEAVSEKQPKWRFLSLYRIVENAYLSNIKKRLILSYDVDAKFAIEEAKKSLQSELNQLVALAEESDLVPALAPFNANFELLLAAQNRFLHSIERSASDEPLYKAQEVYKKAIVRLYKMRCSIAHGGTSSTIFEEHPDGNAALMSLMGDVEGIAVKSLGLELN